MDSLLERIAEVARDCSKIILNADRSKMDITSKEGRSNFATEYDYQVQKEVTKRLTEILPDAGFLCEEGDAISGLEKEYVFVVDPIDGTINFAKDYKVSCISIGLLKNGQRYMGVVYNPYLDEMYTAKKGEGAFLNGKSIHVSDSPLSEGLVLFGTSPYYEELGKRSFELAYEYFGKALDVRRSGSAALDMCAVAAGRAEVYFELLISPWDYAAGALIVTEAGGIAETLEGAEIPCFEKTSAIVRNKRH